MFENLTDKLGGALKKLTGKDKLTEENIQGTIKEIRNALLDADVSLEVVTAFIANISTKVIGTQVSKNLNPSQFFTKVVNDELVDLLGNDNGELNLNAKPPAVILMAGLQGAGKTTTTAKLAKLIKQKYNKSVMVVSCDIYRPAAIDQLASLAPTVDAQFFPSDKSQTPVSIARSAYNAACEQHKDVLIIDTAGRLHVDNNMMEEIQDIHKQANPVETLFVVDSMTGQDAVNSAKAFADALPLTGVVLTKADGDARGGAALSIKYVTNKPIKFIGVGEKVAELESFHPDRIASRILGMGDMLSLIEEIEAKADKQKSEKLAKKIMKGKGMDLADFKEQLMQMQSMGGISSMLDKLPGMANMPAANSKLSDNQIKQMIAIINSMTMKERIHPALIKGSRKQRIAKGSGTLPQDVNRLLKQHQQMQKMMKKFSSKSSMQKMLNRLPPGMIPPNLQ